MIFFVVSRKTIFFSLKNMTLFFRWKIKYDLFQKIHGKIIFSEYSVKMVCLVFTNMILPFCRKSKGKNALKDEISDIIIEKDDSHSRKYCISSDRKFKGDKKFYFYKKVPMIL